MTHSAKWARKTPMGRVSGFLFSLFGRDVAQSWEELARELRRAPNTAHDVGAEDTRQWKNNRRDAVQAQARIWTSMGNIICEEFRLANYRRSFRIDAIDFSSEPSIPRSS